MGSDIATRIRAKLSKRRHSAAPSVNSLATNGSATTGTSGGITSQSDVDSISPSGDDTEKNRTKKQRNSLLSIRSSSSIGRKIQKKSISSSGSGHSDRANSRGQPDEQHKHGQYQYRDSPEIRQVNSSENILSRSLDEIRDNGDLGENRGRSPGTGTPEPSPTVGAIAPDQTRSSTAQAVASPAATTNAATNIPTSSQGNDLQPSTSRIPLPYRSTPPNLPTLHRTSSYLQSINEDSNPSPTTTTHPNADELWKVSPQKQLHHPKNRHDLSAADESHTERQSLNFSQALNSAAAAGPFTPSIVSQFASSPQNQSRRQSLLSHRQSALIKTLLSPAHANDLDGDGFSSVGGVLPIDGNMVLRKVWVKRPHASPTMITVNEEDLVDDVRDMILRKYANSLGRTFDSPDLVIRVHPREHNQKERTLGPEEPMGRTLDAYYPGGQNIDEALTIDIPRRTPKQSPRAPPYTTTAAVIYHPDDGRPSEAGEGYFPPVEGVPSPHLPIAIPATTNGTVPHSIAVLGTGQIPPIPSPGGTRSRVYRDRPERPRLGRTHTSSPTIIPPGPSGSSVAASNHAHSHTLNHNHGMTSYAPRRTHSRTHSHSSDQANSIAPPPPSMPIPGSPVPEGNHPARIATPPPPRLASPRPSSTRPKRRPRNSDQPTLPSGMLNGSVPPINVLIVEDNPINLKLLEAFVKRLKVRWSTAMNGRDAVEKWRTGGFHLVLMDIQLPVMNGLEATREIRRLERVNSIGVFSSSPGAGGPPELESNGELKEADKLENLTLFKSPVIIVALTASSLQSDRHEALAAGCNDFLTKPVNFVWLERKVMEWGCMQALIDFDGWRQWKNFSLAAQESEAKRKAASKLKGKRKEKSSLSSSIG